MDRELQFVEDKELGTVRDAHTFVFHAQVYHVFGLNGWLDSRFSAYFS